MPDQATVNDSLLGLDLGHYRILERVGSGGMGVVYRAYDSHLEREVAIKVLNPGTISDNVARKRFRNEARLLSKLNHPNIATVHDFDTQEGCDFLVMEYIPGVTLSEKLRQGSLPEKEVIALGIQLAEGLCAAHEHAVVHRDLKPGNLRLTTDGRLKILDFGLAKLRAPSASVATESTLESQAITGTLAYMAPEQLLGEEIDARADIYAAALVLYEMATGQRPFAEVESSQLIGAILRKSPIPPSTLNPRLSLELARIITKCLEREPENRYQLARELAVDLRRLARQKESNEIRRESQTTSQRTAVGRHKVLFAAAVSVAVGLLVVAAFQAMRMEKSSGRTQIKPSIAVLPFVDLSPQKDQEYFSDGLAEELLNSLAKIQGLQVAARTSSFQFKGKNEDLRVVGQKLNVASVLEGSVRKQGQRVRITAQLIQTSDGFHLWSETYDIDLTDIFAVQEDIARSVTNSLSVALLGGKVPSPRVTSVEAYNAYLQGQYFYAQPNMTGLEKAVTYYEQSIHLDPNYAPGWAGLSRAHSFRAEAFFGSGERGDGQSTRGSRAGARAGPELGGCPRSHGENQERLRL
jgi:serine/threonine protein kinase